MPREYQGRTDPTAGATRRGFLRGGALALAMAAGNAADATSDPIAAVPSLGELAARRGILFGAAVDRTVLGDPRLAALYRHQTRIVTTDTALKFGSIRPRPEVADYGEADALVDFAGRAGLAMRGHTLAWNSWQPDWVERLSQRECAYWLERHIAETVGRYAGRLHSWDVVNEPLWPEDGLPGGLRGGPWYKGLGADYIRRSFVAARAADPKVRLVLNEAGPEWKQGFSPGARYRTDLLRLVDDLQHAGVRLDAVGLECHWFPGFTFDAEAFGQLVRDLAARDLDVYLTEIDVNDRDFPGDAAHRDALVAARYAELMRAALAEPAVKVIQTWELSDGQTWLREGARPGRAPRPLPFDAEYRPKDAYQAIARALKETRPGVTRR